MMLWKLWGEGKFIFDFGFYNFNDLRIITFPTRSRCKLQPYNWQHWNNIYLEERMEEPWWILLSLHQQYRSLFHPPPPPPRFIDVAHIIRHTKSQPSAPNVYATSPSAPTPRQTQNTNIVSLLWPHNNHNIINPNGLISIAKKNDNGHWIVSLAWIVETERHTCGSHSTIRP